MTYIYDLLLNFTDDDRLVEFYEWQDEDILDHIKKIPLLRISSKQIEEIINYKIKLSRDFLDRIKNKTVSYNQSTYLKYALLVSDLNKVLALEFNNQGTIICRSSLLLDEEEDVLDECSLLDEESISYNRLEKYNYDNFLTRSEIKKKKYLLQELKTLYESKQLAKLSYLYEETYGKSTLATEEKYQKLKKDLETDYSAKHNNLYDIVRLTYIKK